MKTKRNTQQLIKKTNHVVLFIFCLLPGLFVSFTATAHNPSDVTVAYNLETQDLRVTISHEVSDPTTHYINEVRIEKNGAAYNKTAYTSQPDTNSFAYTYIVNATVGDVIDVTVLCNQGGSKTIQHTITTTTNQSEKPSTPGFEILIFIVASILSIMLWRRK